MYDKFRYCLKCINQYFILDNKLFVLIGIFIVYLIHLNLWNFIHESHIKFYIPCLIEVFIAFIPTNLN